jgi:hypothetical protein
MSDVLGRLEQASFVEFVRLFRLEEGRMGVTVTFMALLELVREGLIEIVQAAPFAPLHVRAAGAGRKLHVVGGNDGVIEGGELVDDASAVVVGEAVVRDVPAIPVITVDDAGLESIAAVVLDPNFVDDDFDEDDEPLAGVDDVLLGLAGPTAAPAPDGTAEPGDGGAGVLDGPTGNEFVGEDALADAGMGADAPDLGSDRAVAYAEPIAFASAVQPVSIVDEWVTSVESGTVASLPSYEIAASGLLTGEAADSPAAPDVTVGAIDLEPSALLAEPIASTDAVAASVDSVLAAGSADVLLPTEADGQPVAAQQPSAYEVAAAEFFESPSTTPADVVAGSATALDEAAGVAKPISAVAFIADTFEPPAPAPVTDALNVAVESVLAATPVSEVSHPGPVAEETHLSVGETPHPTAFAEPAVVAGEAGATVELAAVGDWSLADEAAGPTPVDPSSTSLGEPDFDVAGSFGDAIAVELDPSVTTPSAAVEVFDTPTSAAESEPPSDAPADEPPPVDVEYESVEEAVAAGEQPAPDEDVSLIGDTPIAGDTSLVGEESVSGGPAVEVEEFAFDELPALDDAVPADQQPAAGAEAVVNKLAGTDEPPSPGEESDD